ncbi:MAG TPA: tetratricopeptide repeat protein [Candidatus Latescibacteria bacterium]|nr:tetratricopeptide repeat protein [Candidatus Latescibacterota bacterium]
MGADSLMRQEWVRYWPWVLLTLVLLVYANSLGGSFQYDDGHSIVRNPSIRGLSSIPTYFVDASAFSGDSEKRMYRPLLLVSYALNHMAGDFNVVGYHMVNVLLHLACCYLVWRLAMRFSPGRESAACVAAAIFALHPVASEPVNYVSSRSETLMAAFFLLTVFLHLHRPGTIHWGARVCFAMALLSKETAIVLVVVLPLVDLWLPQRGSQMSTRQLARRHGPYWAMAGIYLLVLMWTGFLGGGGEPLRDGGAQFMTQAKALVYYLRLLVLPIELNVDHPLQVSPRLTPVVVLAATLLLTIGLMVLRGRRVSPQLTLMLLFSVLVVLPTSVVPLNILANERRVYLVLASMCIGLPALLGFRSKPVNVALLVVLAAFTIQRNQVWATPLSLWQSALAGGAHSYTAYVNLGKAQQDIGDVTGAAVSYGQALEIDRRRADAYNNLAVLFHEAGRVTEAIPYYEAAVERAPEMEEIHHNLAVAHQDLGDLDAATRTFRLALELSREDGGLWSNYGQLLLAADDPVGAEAAFHEAIRLLGLRPEPYNGLGNALSDQGRIQDAINAYRRGLAANPDRSQRAVILTNLGESLMRSRQVDEAREVLRTSLTLSPSAVAHDYLGRLAFSTSDTLDAMRHWQSALDIDPRRRVPLAGLGEIAIIRGDLERAATLFRRAIDNGAGDRARAGLRRVEAQMMAGRAGK